MLLQTSYGDNQNQTYTNAARAENQFYEVILGVSILLTVVAAEIPQSFSCILAQGFQAQVGSRFPLERIYTIALMMNVSTFLICHWKLVEVAPSREKDVDVGVGVHKPQFWLLLSFGDQSTPVNVGKTTENTNYKKNLSYSNVRGQFLNCLGTF